MAKNTENRQMEKLSKGKHLHRLTWERAENGHVVESHFRSKGKSKGPHGLDAPSYEEPHRHVFNSGKEAADHISKLIHGADGDDEEAEAREEQEEGEE